eukprot:CAMPEP_0174746538 /NCGR_PEP_ID=MMETSP1094-20130205/89251_1 /TAXON_ID=156173 /ORGANISM="Chrysochromulina brevifilum, Strain UTEX LB 985" /LENGTH=40 /DNA_ID= /DNA_START= /DNA_END= /DNA_ORIENTATION=
MKLGARECAPLGSSLGAFHALWLGVPSLGPRRREWTFISS